MGLNRYSSFKSSPSVRHSPVQNKHHHESILQWMARLSNCKALSMNSSKQISQSDFSCSPYVHDGMPEWHPSHLTTLVTASIIFISVINLIVSPCTMVLNALVIIAVKTSPRLKSNYHILLASLAGTDLMTGALAQPPVVAGEIYRLSGNSTHFYKVCLLNNISRITGVYFVTTSILHLMLLSVERYVTITYPYKYLEIMTKRRLISSAVFAWSFAALTVVLSVKDIFPFSFRAFLIVVSISILIFCHIAVYRKTGAQMHKIKSQQVSKEANEVFLKEKKAMNTTTVIIGVVLFSFLPIILQRFIFISLLSSPATKLVTEYACRSLMLCNSVCNPLIYCARNREFRKAFERLLRRQNQIGPA